MSTVSTMGANEQIMGAPLTVTWQSAPTPAQQTANGATPLTLTLSVRTQGAR